MHLRGVKMRQSQCAQTKVLHQLSQNIDRYVLPSTVSTVDNIHLYQVREGAVRLLKKSKLNTTIE